MDQNKVIETDVAIIGGGLAGAIAALSVQKHGRKPIIIKKSPGATALSSGGFDLAENPIQTKFDSPDAFLSVSNNLREIIRRSAGHPYAIIAKERTEDDIVKLFLSASELLLKQIDKDVVQYDGLDLSDGDLTNRYVINQFGWYRQTGFAQKSMAGSDFCTSRGTRVLVVGIKGLANFNAEFVARTMFSLQEGPQLPDGMFERVDSSYIDFPEYEGLAGVSEFEFAERLDDPDIAKPFCERAGSLKNLKEYSHVILPPILGLQKSNSVWNRLEKTIGRTCIEAQPSSYSVPGLRLESAMEEVLKKKGIEIIRGRVDSYTKRRQRVNSIIVDEKDNGKAGKVIVRASSFILATGRFIGGGIRKQRRMVETVFDLPVMTPYGPLKEFFTARLLAKRFNEPQPIFSCGLRVGPDLRPLNEQGRLIFENLYAAGSIIGGYDYVTGGCGFGIAASTGFIAGEVASA